MLRFGLRVLAFSCVVLRVLVFSCAACELLSGADGQDEEALLKCLLKAHDELAHGQLDMAEDGQRASNLLIQWLDLTKELRVAYTGQLQGALLEVAGLILQVLDRRQLSSGAYLGGVLDRHSVLA